MNKTLEGIHSRITEAEEGMIELGVEIIPQNRI